MQENSNVKNLIGFFIGFFCVTPFVIFIGIPICVAALHYFFINGVIDVSVWGLRYSVYPNRINLILIFKSTVKPLSYFIYFYVVYIDYIFWVVNYVNYALSEFFKILLDFSLFKISFYKIFLPMIKGFTFLFFTWKFSFSLLFKKTIIYSIFCCIFLELKKIFATVFIIVYYLFNFKLQFKAFSFLYKNPYFIIKSFIKISNITQIPHLFYLILYPIIFIWKKIWVCFLFIFLNSLFTYTYIVSLIVSIIFLFLYFSINNRELFYTESNKLPEKLRILIKKNFATNLIFCLNYTYLLIFLYNLICNYKAISKNLMITNLLFDENVYNDMFSNISILAIVFFFLLFIKITNNFLVNNPKVSLTVILAIYFVVIYLSLILIFSDLFLVYLGIVGLSLSLYVLIFFDKTSNGGLEAVSKYYFLGAAASGVFLYGMSLFYKELSTFNYYKLHLDLLEIKLIGSSLSLNYNLIIGIVFILLGFCFKLSIVPFHGWTPDVYLGSPTITTCLLSTIIKFGVYCSFMRIYYSVFIQLLKNDKIFKNLILILAISSIIIGAIGACDQTKIKRFLGYTTINQMGFILLGLAVQNFYGFVASYIYLVIYVILNLILFSILLGARYKDRELIYITDLSIFFRNNKHAGLLFILLIFSLAGLPPTIGFFMKFLIIKSLVVSGYLKLAIFILYINVISIFYYVRLVKIIFLNSEDSTELVKTHLNNSSKNSIENVWGLSDKPLTIDEKNEVNFQLFRDSLDSIKHVDLFSVFKKLEDADNKAIIYPVVLLYSKYFVFYLLSYTFISSIWFNWLIHKILILNILADSWLSLNWKYTEYVSADSYVKVLDFFLFII